MALSLDELAHRFRHFARTSARGYCRFYEELALATAEDEELLELAGHVQPGQPPVNMLMASVQYLCARGSEHPMAELFAQAVRERGESSGAEAFATFRDFCHVQRDALAELIATRRTQTNEVGRGAVFYPAFAHARERLNGAPLGMIDVGTSAGLTLFWDRFHYRYRAEDGTVHERGDGASSVRVKCELRGPLPPLPHQVPPIAQRVGIDLHPVDVTDPDQALWLRSLMWPDRLERFERLQSAIALACADPPTIVAGNAADVLPEVLASWPADSVPCVTHSLVLYQFDPADIERLEHALLDTSRRRAVLRLGMEEDPAGDCEVVLFSYRAGTRTRERLGLAHGHARWMGWGS